MSSEVAARDWYECVPQAHGITLIHEPWIKPFFRCNMWLVVGRDRNLLFDSGLGHFSLVDNVPMLSVRPLVAVASHTHFDHIGCHHEFVDRAVHRAEAEILSAPRNELTGADECVTDAMFDCLPEGWDSTCYRVRPAPAHRLLEGGDVLDLGDRDFEVIHTPGHSPGGIGLYEPKTGVFLSGDIVYDGPLVEDAYHSDVAAYVATMERLRMLDVSIVHGGHFPSVGPVRYRQLIDEYLLGKRKAGHHLGG